MKHSMNLKNNSKLLQIHVWKLKILVETFSYFFSDLNKIKWVHIFKDIIIIGLNFGRKIKESFATKFRISRVQSIYPSLNE